MTPGQREWARCRPWIEAATFEGPGLETIESIEKGIETGRFSFWPGLECAAICEIRQYEGLKALVVVAGGGDLAELLDRIEPMLAEHARLKDCDIIMGEGRDGWRRAAAKRGYRFGFVTMVKELRH